MKKIKKIFAACMATLIAGATLGSMSALSSSAALMLGDVNCDGSIDITDVVALNRYLAGRCELKSDFTPDTNQNYIIDQVDVLILEMFLTREIISLPYTG